MHRAKDAGDSRVYFSPTPCRSRQRTPGAAQRPAPSVEAKPAPLLLHHQPQVDSQGRLAGVEALVRWQTRAVAWFRPCISSQAEASGLIVPLGNWVLEEAATTLHRWQNDPACARWATKLTMAVNVSAVSSVRRTSSAALNR